MNTNNNQNSNNGNFRDNRNQQSRAESQPHRDRRGFASMDPQKQREIAAKGGRAAHEKGTAHEFSSEEARKAGQKGGSSRRTPEQE